MDTTLLFPELAWEDRSQAEQLALLPDAERQVFFAAMPDAECEALEHDWSFWGRPQQLPPEHEDWDVFLMLAGRGAGKTRPGAELVHQWAAHPGWYLALVGETAAEVRDVMIEGTSGLLATHKPWNPCTYEPSKRRVVWANGSWATCFSGDSPDQLRGPNVHGAWVDELAKFRYPQQTWDNLEMVLRAGTHPRVVVSTTPRPLPLLRELLTDARTCVRRWSTYRNAKNLAPTFLQRLLRRYEGTRLGRQELHAELLTETPGALWTQALLEQTRVATAPVLVRMVLGVDPAASSQTETGIIAAGLAANGEGYVMDDVSLAASPAGWGAQVVSAYTKWRADRACAEANNGGDMVIATITTAAQQARVTVATKKLHASRGKYARAEPVASLYEQKRVHHVGVFPKLEDELCTWVPNEGLPSPNRLDAVVWALTELMLARGGPAQRGRVRS